MARSDIQFTRGAPLSGAIKAKTKDKEPPAEAEKEGRSLLHRKTRIVSAWTSHRHSSQGSSRSSSRLADSKDSLQSATSTASGISPSEVKPRVSMSSARATPVLSTVQAWTSDSHRWSSVSALDTTSSPEALYHPPQKTKSIMPNVHIKPLLRKMSSRDDSPSTSIDLSRPAIEHEGLGIYVNLERDRRQGGPSTKGAPHRSVSGLHHRSTSGTSQFSAATTSTVSKPGSQYVHPMRQIPRPHTPPLGQSYQNSMAGSEDSTERTRLSSDADSLERSNSEDSDRFTPEIPTHGPRLSLHVRDSSFAGFPEPSQTNITGKASAMGHAMDSTSILETISPLSRSSLDFTFRSKTRANTDPLSRAATVQAARQAFEEKEAAKTRKFEKQQMKAQERELRRREKKQQQKAHNDHPTYVTASGRDVTEKPNLPDGLDYSFLPDSTLGDYHQSRTMPLLSSQSKSRSWRSSFRNTWMLFLTWLRTRLFKLGRKVRRSC
ncbi:hypothetical protein VTN02DRAFT_4035 [Thermoascus thermophilus]